jgi:hypothetical protein
MPLSIAIRVLLHKQTNNQPNTAAFGGAIAISNPTNVGLTVALGTISGFGVGGILVPAATLAMIVVPDNLLATTAALSLSIRTVGGSIGYTIYYNIFINKLVPALPKFIIENLLDAGLSASDARDFAEVFMTAPATVTHLASYSSQIEAAAVLGEQWAYAYALKYVWYTSIPFGCLAVLSALFLPDIRKYQTDRVAVSL